MNTYQLHTLNLAAIVRAALCSGDTGCLACVHLTVGPNGGLMEATDGLVAYRERFTLDNADNGQEAIDACISMGGIKSLKAWLKCLPKKSTTVVVNHEGKVLTLSANGATCSLPLLDTMFPNISQAMNAQAATIGISETGLNLEQLSKAHKSLDCDKVRVTWTGRAFILIPLSGGADKAALVMSLIIAPRV